MRGSQTIASVALATWLASCGNAVALDPSLDISQYAHTAWRVRDGFAKRGIQAIAQTSDGYLWLGTEFGLLRFDGVRAVPWLPPGEQLPSNNILELLVGRDGTLWIGTDRGLASWKQGTLARYDAFSGRRITKLLEDRDGAIWNIGLDRVPGPRSLCMLQRGRVECYGGNGGPGAGAIGLFETRNGELWVGTLSGGLWRWKPGAPRYFPLPPQPNGLQGLTEADDGSLLISAVGGIRRLAEGATAMAYPFPASIQPAQSYDSLRDRDGGLWFGTPASGLVHVHQGVTDVFGRSDGLSGDRIFDLFEDREGSIWVATEDGLDRFRNPIVSAHSVGQGLSNPVVTSVLAAKEGSIWVGTFDGLNRLHDGQVTVYRQRRGRSSAANEPHSTRTVNHITDPVWRTGPVSSIFEDRLGRVWVSMGGGVGYFENGRFTHVEGIPGGVTRAIVEDSENLWVVDQDRGLFGVSSGQRDLQQIPWASLNREPATAVAADPPHSGVWLGFDTGEVAHVAAGRVRASYAARDGLAAGPVRHLRLEAGGTLWAATDGGLSRLKNGRVATLTSKQGLPCDAVGWTVEDLDHSMWLGTACGLVRIARAEIDAWAATAEQDSRAPRTVLATVFDSTDGARVSSGTYYTAPAVTAADGRLWFVSQDGVSVVDPRHLPFNSLPPPVQIEQVTADRKPYEGTAANGRINLPALTRDLQIDYTALSLVAPEKMQFRYILEGHDSDWQDVGTRRQAFYNDLRPGNYRFRVTATNNSGVWNETGAFLDFSVAPAYYQTTWFAALSITAVMALVWGGHRIRLRIVEKHKSEISALNERLMKAQEQERIRIAGELHDGVMQEMLAVTMMLGTAKRRIPDSSDAKATIDKAQQKLIQAGTDIRQLSHDLHPPLLQEAGLPKAVHAYCEQFSTAHSIAVACEADERVGELSRGAALALFRIVQEALGNAAKHASARRIIVRLTRSDSVVSLTVSDDGVGLDRSRLASGGGLGLVMMRERATQLNGTFDFDSAPGRGTTISVVVPFR